MTFLSASSATSDLDDERSRTFLPATGVTAARSAKLTFRVSRSFGASGSAIMPPAAPSLVAAENYWDLR